MFFVDITSSIILKILLSVVFFNIYRNIILFNMVLYLVYVLNFYIVLGNVFVIKFHNVLQYTMISSELKDNFASFQSLFLTFLFALARTCSTRLNKDRGHILTLNLKENC